MSPSRTFPLRSALAVVAALGLLAACHDRSGSDEMPVEPTTQSVGELATRQVNTLTCEQGAPESIAEVEVTESDAVVDVATLTPACASGS